MAIPLIIKLLPKAFVSTVLQADRLANRSFTEQLMCTALTRMIKEGEGEPLAHLRQKMESFGAYSKNTAKVKVEHRQIENVHCSIVTPKSDVDSDRVVLFLHGGGYIAGSSASYMALIADIAVATHSCVIAPDYGLAPEAAFPRPQQDCLAVGVACAQKYKGRKVSIVGDSAGGGLAICTAQSLNAAGVELDSLVLISPWVDPTDRSGSIISNAQHDFLVSEFLDKSVDALMQGQDVNDPRVNFSNVDLSNLPRTLVQYGSAELFHDQIRRVCQQALDQGVDLVEQCYSDQCHDFQLFASVSATARLAVARIGEFIQAA